MSMSKKNIFRMKRSAKIGTYTFVMGVVVLAVLVVANLIVGALPAKFTKFDTTNLGLTEISDETAKFVSGLEEDVTIYWVCEDGLVDDQFRLLLTRYEEAGRHITVEVVDPLTSPTFTAQYTDAELSNYSLIVESARRYQVVDADDMYYYTNDFITQYFYSGTEVPLTYDELEQYYSYYSTYMSSYDTHVYFQGETLLTSAIDYVTKEAIPHAYILTGHGDDKLSDTMLELLSSMNVTTEEINLQNETAVPSDANCLILYAPSNDISDHEATIIKEYLNAGGSLMLATSPANVEDCPNVMSLGEVFGLSAAEGMVAEGDTSYTAGSSQYTLVPNVSTENYATYYVSNSGYTARMPKSHAIEVAESLPSGVTVTPLFTTSDKATRVSMADTGVALSEAGTLNVAVAASKSVTTADGTADTADITWFASTEAFTDEQANNTSGGNYYYFAATLSIMSESFSSAFEALAGVNLSGEYLSGLTTASALTIGAIVVIVIPVGLLVTGIVIWVRRKRR